MTLGTPGFVGDRLREAREAQGLSQAELARIVESTRQSISAYEKGAITPAPHMTRSLAGILGVLPSFFQRSSRLGREIPPSSSTYFRSNSKALERDRRKGGFRVDLLVELLSSALEAVEIPSHNLPSLSLSARPEYIDRKYIEAVTSKLREGWGIGRGPIQNVVWLLENQGVVVVRDPVATNHIDAFSCWRGPYPIIVLTTAKESAVRSRWDAAHELGHLILHRDIDRARLAGKEGLAIIEQQADWFAGSFLLPAETFRRSIIMPSLEEFLEVKPKWMVSIQAQLQRAFALGMVSESARARMWKQISLRGWRYREPLDDDLEPEQPELLRRSIEIGIEDGTLDLDAMSTQIGVPADKIQVLLNLRQNTSTSPMTPDNLLVFPDPRHQRLEV